VTKDVAHPLESRLIHDVAWIEPDDARDPTHVSAHLSKPEPAAHEAGDELARHGVGQRP
jgi:hypothetical protein